MRKNREQAKEKEAEKAKDNSNDDDNIQLSEAKSQNNNNNNIYLNKDAINSDYSTGTEENGDMEEKTRRTKWKNQLVTCILCSDSIDRTISALYCPYHMEERIR